MKKVFKNLMLITLTIFMVLLTTTTLNAQTRPDSFTLDTNSYKLPVYVDGYSFYGLTSNNGVVYCLDYKKPAPSGMVVYFHSERDAGFAYILENGYPNKSITGNKEKDIYITQMAMWRYMDLTTSVVNLGNYYVTATDLGGVKTHIDNLTSKAQIAKAQGYVDPTIKISYQDADLEYDSSKDAFVSKPISVSGTKLTGEYTVSLTNAPSKTKITDVSGVAKTKFKFSEKFIISINKSDLSDLSATISLKVAATGFINKAYEYRPKDNSYQNTMPAVLYKEYKDVSETARLHLKTSKVKVVKLDQNTNKPLPGATLAIYNSSNKQIAKWTSTNDYFVLSNLSDGTYYVKELMAPEGYKLNNELIEFSINNSNREVVIKFVNEPKTSVVTITKIDKDTKEILEGATLVIKDAEGVVIKTFTTTKDPFVLTDLPYGIYTVTELEAPEGYKLSEEVYEFVINAESNTFQIAFENEKEDVEEVEVPPTSAFSNIMFTIMGLSLLTMTTVYVRKNEI